MTLLALAGWALDAPYVLVLPVAVLIAWWGFARTDLYLSTILCLVPLSVNLSEFGLTSIGWYMPTEPMLFALLVLFVAKWFSGQTPNRDFLSHPVTYVIAAGFLWMGLTVLPSSDVVVSLKAWVSRAWFIVSFYVLLAEWFRHDPRALALHRGGGAEHGGGHCAASRRAAAEDAACAAGSEINWEGEWERVGRVRGDVGHLASRVGHRGHCLSH